MSKFVNYKVKKLVALLMSKAIWSC